MGALGDGVLRSRLRDLKQQFREAPGRSMRFCRGARWPGSREAAARHVGLRPYLVQLAGCARPVSRATSSKWPREKARRCTAALAVVLNGWSGLPCHVITVNDYLAERDSRWMGPLYRFCGLSRGL